MKLKTFEHEGKSYAVLDAAGLPVYVHDDGKEIGFDAIQATGKIATLNNEAKGHREAKEAAELRLKAFEGIEDGEAARAALDTVANLASGELTTAAKVQEIKDAAKRAAEEQVAAAVKAKDAEMAKVIGERDGFKGALDKELIGGGFSRSKFIADKIAIPADIMQAQFGGAFKVEDGKLVAYDHKGGKIFSRARPGDLADFDEAVEELVNAYPHRDNILKGTVGAGGGAGGSAEVANAKTMSKAAFATLDAKTRAAKMAEPGFTITDQ